ncbi:MAG TPA: chemotaxis protein CheW [Planctomycetaceae bacterium]|nr:chemotaxis protein CheW [Planctomycetaceae bacterium]
MSVAPVAPDASLATAALGGKYLTFRIAGDQFGVPILQVREIIGLMPMTPVPGAPDDIKGVINLRGKIIPVMDVRERFHLETTAANDRNCIVVVELTSDGRSVEMGMLVDAVSEVLNIKNDDIAPPPDFGMKLDTSCLLGIAKTGKDVKVLLDLEQIVFRSASDLAAVEAAVEA